GQIEEPEIHRILSVAEDEVGLAGARRHLRRNLDRDRVGELGCLSGWRRDGLGKGVRGGWLGASWRLPRRGGGFFLFLRRHGKRWPVLPRLLRAQGVPSH